MRKSPAFQFYPSAWLSSPKVAQMTPAEEGAYIRLLCYCWDDIDCSLPDDDEILARLSRMGEGWLKGGSRVVKGCFNQHPSKKGFLTNPRLMQERKKQEKWREKSIQGGKNSAQSRTNNALKGGSRVVEPMVNSLSLSLTTNTKKDLRVLKSKKSMSWPEDFCITQEHQDLANELQVNCKSEFDQFKDWALSKGTTYKNWNHAFRNWLRQAKNFNRSKNSDKQKPKTGSELIWEKARQLQKTGE